MTVLWKMMWVQGYEFSNGERVPPHIDLFVLAEWQVLYEDCVSFDCLCQ